MLKSNFINLRFESLVNQEYRTLNKYICNQIHGEFHNLQKLNYGESSQTPQREFTSESNRHVMDLFYQEKHQKSIPTL